MRASLLWFGQAFQLTGRSLVLQAYNARNILRSTVSKLVQESRRQQEAGEPLLMAISLPLVAISRRGTTSNAFSG